MLRRSFLSRLSAAAAVVGVPPAQQSGSSRETPREPWHAARHEEDDWFDRAPAKHRVIFDTYMSRSFADAVLFAGNYIEVNAGTYHVAESDLAVVMVLRHQTAPFAFTDALWAKYGTAFSNRMQFTDPKTHEAPNTNIYAARMAELVKRGMQLAVCSLTTRAYARIVAQQAGIEPDAAFKELTSNTIGNSHFVPAGVVAVTRAQERGYALVSVS